MGEKDRGHQVEKISRSFYCANGHETHPQFAASKSVRRDLAGDGVVEKDAARG